MEIIRISGDTLTRPGVSHYPSSNGGSLARAQSGQGLTAAGLARFPDLQGVFGVGTWSW